MSKRTGSPRVGKGVLLGVVAALFLVPSAALSAQEYRLTAETLIDRAEINDLLTHYYYNLGHGKADSFSTFYADGAELVLGPQSYKGKDGIENAYKAADKASPVHKNAFSFNVTLSNPLIIVRGDTATAQVIFTETIIDTEGAAPRLLAQGREYDNLVKINGRWLFKKRQIMAGTQSPASWPG